MSYRNEIIKIKKFFIGLPRFLAERVFLFSIILFFVAFLISGFLFYQYYILAERAEAQPAEVQIKLKEKTKKEVLDTWKARQQRMRFADVAEYPDLFNAKVTIEELSE